MWLRDVRRTRLVVSVAMAAAVTVIAFLTVAVADTATASVPGHSWRPKPTASPRPTASPTQSPITSTSPSPSPSPSPSSTVSTSPTAGPTVPSSPVPSSPGPSSCASGAAPVEYGGSSYCPGYVFAVRRTLYGVDTRIVLRGVVVESVSGSQVRIAGGPSCLPTEWCGQLIPSMTVTFPTGAVLPAYADVISLHRTTITGGLTPGGFETTGHCDPYRGDC